MAKKQLHGQFSSKTMTKLILPIIEQHYSKLLELNAVCVTFALLYFSFAMLIMSPLSLDVFTSCGISFYLSNCLITLASVPGFPRNSGRERSRWPDGSAGRLSYHSLDVSSGRRST